MLSPNQSCDLIKETNSACKLVQSANCSNNSTIISSIESTPISTYSIDKQPNLISPNVVSQTTTPQFLSSTNLRQLQVAISPISFKTDTELLNQLSVDELIYSIKNLEAKNRKLIFENGCLIKEINGNLANIQLLRHNMLEMKKDNNELRDLCCYLDDERTRAKEIAREWQSFGDHMSSVLKKEINNYNQKLQSLESKQFELVKENYELKQLCLLLDKAMINKTVDNKQNNREVDKEIIKKNDQSMNDDLRKKDESDLKINQDATGESTKRKSLINHKILNYIKLLENELDQLGKNQRLLIDKLTNDQSTNDELKNFEFNVLNIEELKTNRPDELSRAMEILCIEQSIDEQNLESKKVDDYEDEKLTNEQSSRILDESNLSMNEDQKSIIKQLCGVAYKKIENDG